MGTTYTVPLLSKGKFYEGNVAELEFRKMKTPERVILASAKSPTQKIRAILSNCLVSPDSFDVADMLAQDAAWCIMHIRAESIEPTYRWSAQCTSCGEANKITRRLPEDLVNITEAGEGVVEPFEVTIGKGEDSTVYACKYLRVGSQLSMERNKKNNPHPEEDLIAMMAMRIQSIDGKEVKYREAVVHFKELDYLPSLELTDKVAEGDFGNDMTVPHTCTTCGEDFKASVEMSAEFFRPSGS